MVGVVGSSPIAPTSIFKQDIESGSDESERYDTADYEGS